MMKKRAIVNGKARVMKENTQGMNGKVRVEKENASEGIEVFFT